MIGQCKSGGGGAKHAQGFKWLESYIHDGNLPEIGSFFLDELELWGNICSQCLHLFFNEHEVFIKTAQLIQSYEKGCLI